MRKKTKDALLVCVCVCVCWMQFGNCHGDDGGSSSFGVGGNSESFYGHDGCGAVQGGFEEPKRGVVRGSVVEPGVFHVPLPQVSFAGDQAPRHPLQYRLYKPRAPLRQPRIRVAQRRPRPQRRLLRRRGGRGRRFLPHRHKLHQRVASLCFWRSQILLRLRFLGPVLLAPIRSSIAHLFHVLASEFSFSFVFCFLSIRIWVSRL